MLIIARKDCIKIFLSMSNKTFAMLMHSFYYMYAQATCLHDIIINVTALHDYFKYVFLYFIKLESYQSFIADDIESTISTKCRI